MEDINFWKFRAIQFPQKSTMNSIHTGKMLKISKKKQIFMYRFFQKQIVLFLVNDTQIADPYPSSKEANWVLARQSGNLYGTYSM